MLDAADGYYGITSAKEGLKWGIAMVIVFFPTYLVLTRVVNKGRRDSASHSYLDLRKSLINLSILIARGILLGDLVEVIMANLNGDITEYLIFYSKPLSN